MQRDAIYWGGVLILGIVAVEFTSFHIYNLQIDAIIDQLAKNMFCNTLSSMKINNK